MTLDLKLFYFLNNLAGKSKIFDVFIVFLASYLQYFLIAVFFLFLYFSIYPKRKKLCIFLTVTISVIVARLGATEIIRFFYHRSRPFVVHQVNQLISINKWSFPSGHSAFFFAMAVAVCFYNKKWGIGFFIAALIMNISRIIVGVHYPSDILGGMIVGIITAYVVFFLIRQKKIKLI